MLIRKKTVVLVILLIIVLGVWFVIHKKASNSEFARFNDTVIGFDAEYPKDWGESGCPQNVPCVAAFDSGNISLYATTTSPLRRAEFLAADFAIGSELDSKSVGQITNTYGVRFFYFDYIGKYSDVTSNYFFDTPKGKTVRIVAQRAGTVRKDGPILKNPKLQAFVDSISFIK